MQLDRDWGKIEREKSSKPAESATAQDLAYVIYTSGSTGTQAKPAKVALTADQKAAFDAAAT